MRVVTCFEAKAGRQTAGGQVLAESALSWRAKGDLRVRLT